MAWFREGNLVERSRSGDRLGPPELSYLMGLIESGEAQDEYAVVVAIGRSDIEMSTEKFIASVFHHHPDAWTRRAAFWVLVRQWGLAGKYLEDLLAILRGAEWDEDEDCRLVAVSAAGEYLRRHRERGLLQELFRIASNEDEDKLLRRCAVKALARAAGHEWTQMPQLGLEPCRVRDLFDQANNRQKNDG